MFPVRPLLALTLLAAQLPPSTPLTPVPSAAAVRAEIAVGAVDARGEPRRDLRAEDLTVREEGEARPVLGVAPAAGSWRLVVYVDRVLGSTATVRTATGALAAQARELVALGTVELVVAEPEPGQALPPTRDPYAIDEALSRLALTGEGRDEVNAERSRFREEAAGGGGEAAAEAAEAEAARVRRQQDALVGWLAGQEGTGPRALFLVSGGFDLDPREFYRSPGDGPGDLREQAAEQARAIAALGWTVLPLPVDPVRLPGRRWRVLAGDDEVPLRVGVTLGRKDRKEDEEQPEPPAPPLLLRPREPLQLLADASGGEVVTNPLALPAAVARLAGRLLVRYEAARPADGKARAVEVRSRQPRLTVAATRWDATGLPEEVAAVRARRLLDGEPEEGELPVVAAVQLAGEGAAGSGAVEVRLEGAALPAGEGSPAGPLRLTLAAPEGEAGARVTHRLLTREELARPEGWSGPVSLPEDADRLAVLVEDLGGPGAGAWGGTLAAVLAPGAPAEEPVAPEAAASLLPPPPPVRLRLPGEAGKPLAGRVRLRADAPAPEVARVEFLVDGRRAAGCGPPPCEARVDLGRQPRLRRLEAVAYAADGAELGRDAARTGRAQTVAGGLRVRIVRPTAGKAVGPVDVEAEVDVPAGRRLDRVELFWNEALAATLYAPPFRGRVRVPADRPVGYIRVAALLADGTEVEDAVPVNGAEVGDRVEVRLAELFVVVTDGAGKPVRGLARTDFRVRRGDALQEIAGFDEAGDLPITLGLAVDSSASMFRKLPDVQGAVRSLLRGLADRDGALLVDFDTHPRLAAPATRDLGEVSDALERLRPDGDSALWEAVAFTLGQLRAIRGRKALLLYSDGIVEGEPFPYTTCLRLARESGVPVYLIVNHSGVERGGLLGPRSQVDRIRRLGEATGGKAYFVRRNQDVARLYGEILAELRSQYLLTYYLPEGSLEGGHEVRVEVAKKGLTARALSAPVGP